MTNQTITIVLKGQGADDVKRSFDDVEERGNKLGSTLGKVGTIASGFLAANVVQAGVGALTGFIGDSVTAARESIAVNAQLDAVLKSTGGTAGITAEQARDLASALEKTSTFEDEAVINGENLLLTFTGIGQDVFPQATQTMVDMSQALGQDMKSSAIQLGKALNDPINGVTALSRVGVSFTEEQKAQIKTMQEAGDVAGAQTLILNELNKEFGGSAKAASDAAGKEEVYKDKMNDLKEEIGGKMLPIQQKLTEAKLLLVDVLVTKVIPILEELVNKYWPSISKAIGDVVSFIQEHWPMIQPIFEFAAEFIKARVEGAIQVIQGVAEVVEGVVNLVDDLIHGRWSQVWEDMKQIATGIIDIFIGEIKYTFGSIPGILLDLIGSMWSAGRDFIGGLIDGIKSALSNFSFSINIDAIHDPVFGKEITPSVHATIHPFSFAVGTPYVPENMLAFLHKGEAVIPASMNKGGMGQGITIEKVYLPNVTNAEQFMDEISRMQADQLRFAHRGV